MIYGRDGERTCERWDMRCICGWTMGTDGEERMQCKNCGRVWKRPELERGDARSDAREASPAP